MAAINFPNSPTLNEIYLAENGLNYQWDGDKWVVYIAPSQNNNYWQRDTNGATSTLMPINSGDDLAIQDGTGNTIKFSVDASSGDTDVVGTITFGALAIDALGDLP